MSSISRVMGSALVAGVAFVALGCDSGQQETATEKNMDAYMQSSQKAMPKADPYGGTAYPGSETKKQ